MATRKKESRDVSEQVFAIVNVLTGEVEPDAGRGAAGEKGRPARAAKLTP